jgi:hypothetical protein
MKELIVEGTYNLIENNKFILPENIKQIKIDVGLAGEAPNSAIWLSETDDRFVIGIEPLKYHWGMIKNFETSNTLRPYPMDFKILQVDEGVIKYNRHNVGVINQRFCGLECAIDNVEGIQKRIFYQINREGGASGASSLLEPNQNHPQSNQIETILEVKTISLESILNYIPFDKFGYIEHIKTDCEGYDFEVVKSIGKYLDKVVFISSEFLKRDLWNGKPSDNDFINFMVQNNFSILSEGNGEINFINNKLQHKIKEDKLNNKTLGL